MAIFDIFSKRQKRLRGEVPDIYEYNVLPSPLRIQIVQIIQDAIRENKGFRENKPKEAYEFIHETLCREYGVFRLGEKYQTDEEQVLNHLLQTEDVEKALDVVELSFRFINRIIKKILIIINITQELK